MFEYHNFKKEVLALTELDLDWYKEAQMKRRIDTLIARRGAENYEDYARRLRDDFEELAIFTNYLTINVTEFFRDGEPWLYLENEVLPTLVERFGDTLKVWCSAASTGEEAYSLAMSLSRVVPVECIHILATDVDREVLATAAKGEYTWEAVQTVPDDLRERFFVPSDLGYRVTQELRDCVEFHRLDLHHGTYPSECHLITSRNVLIYFTAEAKERIFDGYARSLVSGGCLFTGKTEQIVNWKRSAYMRDCPSFYYKR